MARIQINEIHISGRLRLIENIVGDFFSILLFFFNSCIYDIQAKKKKSNMYEQKNTVFKAIFLFNLLLLGMICTYTYISSI